MKIIFNVSIVILFLQTLSLSASEVVATVNGEEITQKDVNEFVVTSIPGASFSKLTESEKKSVVNKMIERKLFVKDAEKIHIEENPAFIKELKKLKENLMLNYWMKQKVEEIEIDDKEAKAYYKRNFKKFIRAESVKVRHILVATNSEALAIILQLKKEKIELKKKFIEFAKKKSTGPSSVNGGELDWFVKEQMVPEFSNAAFALKEGTITEKPVKTQFGYHIIYLEKRRKKGSVPFEKVKKEIVKSLRLVQFKTKLEKLSEKLKKTAKISVK